MSERFTQYDIWSGIQPMIRTAAITIVATLATGLVTARADDSQAMVAAPVGTVVQKLHAVGAQIYECKADGGGGLAWSFREPTATLIRDGKTVGRHFVGPTWEMSDGSLVIGKVVGKAPGATAGDIPWLRLDVSRHQGDGSLNDVTTVQRLATVGGNRAGPCPMAGAIAAEPYAADYVFSRP